MVDARASLGVDVEGRDDLGDAVVAEPDAPSDGFWAVARLDDAVMMTAGQNHVG